MTININENTNSLLTALTRAGMDNAAEGLSKMAGTQMTVSNTEVGIVSLFDLPDLVGELESEKVALYLRAEGELAGQILITMTYTCALAMVDNLIGEPVGTTTGLDSLAKSALGEVGNLCGTFFLNSVAEMTGLGARPTPPAVVIDMIGSILDIVIATSIQRSEDVLLIKANLVSENQESAAEFWVIPDTGALGSLKPLDR